MAITCGYTHIDLRVRVQKGCFCKVADPGECGGATASISALAKFVSEASLARKRQRAFLLYREVTQHTYGLVENITGVCTISSGVSRFTPQPPRPHLITDDGLE